MCLTHAEEYRWSTVCCVAGLFVVAVSVLVGINFDVCWSSLSLSFGRGMRGPGQGHVKDTTALLWEETVTIFNIMTTERNQIVACFLSLSLSSLLPLKTSLCAFFVFFVFLPFSMLVSLLLVHLSFSNSK